GRNGPRPITHRKKKERRPRRPSRGREGSSPARRRIGSLLASSPRLLPNIATTKWSAWVARLTQESSYSIRELTPLRHLSLCSKTLNFFETAGWRLTPCRLIQLS